MKWLISETELAKALEVKKGLRSVLASMKVRPVHSVGVRRYYSRAQVEELIRTQFGSLSCEYLKRLP